MRERTVVAPAVWTFGIAKHTSISVSHAMPLVRDLITAIPSAQGSPWPHHARTLLWPPDDSGRREELINIDTLGNLGLGDPASHVLPFLRDGSRSSHTEAGTHTSAREARAMAALALAAPVVARAGTRGETKRQTRRTPGASRGAIRGARQTPARIVSERERDAVARDISSDRSIDPASPAKGRTRALALGAATLACLAAADPAAAKEVVLQVPELEFPSFDLLQVPPFPDLGSLDIDPVAFARFTLSNPPAAVAASVAAYVVIPRAAKVLTKYVLIPAVVLAVLAAVAEDPAGAGAAASAAAREAAAHPTETSAVILALAFLALSPYILLAALLALILSGAQVLPEKLSSSKLVPTPVRVANERVKSAQKAAEPGVRAARGAVDGARDAAAKRKAQAEQAERAAQEAARKAQAEQAERTAQEAARLRAREEETRRRAEQAASAIEEAEEAARAAAAAAAAAAAETANSAASTTRCASRETAALRAQCVDEQRAARKQADAERTRERKAQADRLRAESARRAGAIPSLPGRP